MQIAIAYQDRIQLWCDVKRTNQDGKVHFYVNNGAWDGWFHDGIVHVNETGKSIPGARIIWQGKAPFTSWHYNEAIEWIHEQVGDIDTCKDARTRDYLWITPSIKADDLEEYDEEDEYDDIPF